MDSTGLKLCGSGEWLGEKHRTKTRRSWRKLRLGIGGITHQQLPGAIAAGETVWVLSNAVDMPYAQALQAELPAQTAQTWRCGQVECIEAVEWAARNPNAVTSKQVGGSPNT